MMQTWTCCSVVLTLLFFVCPAIKGAAVAVRESLRDLNCGGLSVFMLYSWVLCQTHRLKEFLHSRPKTITDPVTKHTAVLAHCLPCDGQNIRCWSALNISTATWIPRCPRVHQCSGTHRTTRTAGLAGAEMKPLESQRFTQWYERGM